MNHDYAHCLDYDPAQCPLSCFRAELTQDYRDRSEDDMRGIPVSWMHFLGGRECLRGWRTGQDENRQGDNRLIVF